METANQLSNLKAYIWKESFSIIKAKRVYPNAFANIIDKNEITVIAEHSTVNNEDIIEIEEGWRIITFDAVLQFGLVGFLSRISAVLASENISIFAISAFSTDHILVKNCDIEKTKDSLEKAGFLFTEKN